MSWPLLLACLWVLAAVPSMFRNPLGHLARRAMGKPADSAKAPQP